MLVFPQHRAGLAQLVEQLICNQQVIGSSPIAGSFQRARVGSSANSANASFKLIIPRNRRPVPTGSGVTAPRGGRAM